MKFAHRHFRLFVIFAALVCASSLCSAQSSSKSHAWIATWGAAQQIPEPSNTLPPDDLRDATVRQIFHLSAGGSVLRVHISNAFGTEALHFSAVHIARPLAADSSTIDLTTDRALTFSGTPDVTVPPGAEFISDPIFYPVAPLSNLAVTFYLKNSPARETSHPGSRATSYYAHGNLVNAATLPNANRVDHWFQISEIDVEAAPAAASVVRSATPLPTAMLQPPTATTAGPTFSPSVFSSRQQRGTSEL